MSIAKSLIQACPLQVRATRPCSCRRGRAGQEHGPNEDAWKHARCLDYSGAKNFKLIRLLQLKLSGPAVVQGCPTDLLQCQRACLGILSDPKSVAHTSSQAST